MVGDDQGKDTVDDLGDRQVLLEREGEQSVGGFMLRGSLPPNLRGTGAQEVLDVEHLLELDSCVGGCGRPHRPAYERCQRMKQFRRLRRHLDPHEPVHRALRGLQDTNVCGENFDLTP